MLNMLRERPALAGLGAAAAIGLAWVLVGRAPADPVALVLRNREAVADFAVVKPWRPAGAVASAAASSRSPEVFQQWLVQSSSLRGAELDGSWGVDAAGRLQPSRDLRRRFDQLLTLQGETSVDEITRHIAAQVLRLHGAAASAAVLERFGAYVSLLRQPYRSNPSSADREQLALALAERHAARQQWLGKAWADAFFAGEEDELRALIDSPLPGSAAASAAARNSPTVVIGSAGVDDRALDAAARERLSAERASWQAWESRLNAARDAKERFLAAPELSVPQRDAALDAWLIQHFSGSELRRAQALLRRAL